MYLCVPKQNSATEHCLMIAGIASPVSVALHRVITANILITQYTNSLL